MFSIVIPLYNEAQNINELLREIKQQNFPYKNFEIILVDDCSIDDTIKVIKENNDLSNIQIIKNNEQFRFWTLYIRIPTVSAVTVHVLSGLRCEGSSRGQTKGGTMKCSVLDVDSKGSVPSYLFPGGWSAIAESR